MNKTKLTTLFTFLLMVISSAHGETYVLEKDHTYATFKIMHQSKGMQPGIFKDVTGKLDTDSKGNIKKINVEIDVNSVETWHPTRDAHLKSPDFFNVKRYPKMKFKSTKVIKKGPGKYEIEGDITIHGVTKRIKVKGTQGTVGKDPFGGYRTGGNVYLSLKRRDFGMNHMPDEIVGNEVEIDLFWEALEEGSIAAYEAGLKKALSGGK